MSLTERILTLELKTTNVSSLSHSSFSIFALKCFLLSIILYLPLSLDAQHEVTIEDIGANGDAVIEIVVDSSDNIEARKMILGLNQSSQGFLRMRTDHDLSFWTFNQKRMTIKNSGEVGIGTGTPLEELYVKNGSLGLETETFGLFGTEERSSLNFYTGSTYQGGITYGDGDTDGKFMSFNNTGNSAFFWSSNNQIRMRLNNDGTLRINDLEGVGSRQIYADENGTLTTESSSRLIAVKPSQFIVSNLSEDNKLKSNGRRIKGDFPLLVDKVFINANPSIPHSKYLIEEVTFYFYDNESEDISFQVFKSLEFSPTGSSSGASTSVRNITIPVNEIVDDTEDYKNWTISVGFFNESHTFYKAVVKYKPLD